MTLYHVTHTRLVRRIQRDGLLTLQTSNWSNGAGEPHYGGGAIHAFESRMDALRWAAKMDWLLHKESGSGRISIIAFEPPDVIQWDDDFNDTLSQMGRQGSWLKTFVPVPPAAIRSSEQFTQDLARQLVL